MTALSSWLVTVGIGLCGRCVLLGHICPYAGHVGSDGVLALGVAVTVLARQWRGNVILGEETSPKTIVNGFSELRFAITTYPLPFAVSKPFLSPCHYKTRQTHVFGNFFIEGG
jgi:hypothetical protein